MKDTDLLKKVQENTIFSSIIFIISLVLLVAMEVVVCAQYLIRDINALNPWVLAVVIFCYVSLDAFCVIEMYGVKPMVGKMILFFVEMLLLSVICLLTSGSVYLSAMFCIILTQAYTNLRNFLNKIIIFIISCLVYTISYFVGYFLFGGSSIVSVVSDMFFGSIILAIHFVVTNFLLRFYFLNVRLTHALDDANASRERLQEVYQQLSESAVYEERNRIASDIHDNAGHSMTTVIMQTEAAKRLIDTNPEAAKKAIISANMQAKNALEQMRESVHLLAGREGVTSAKTIIEEIVAQTIDGTQLKIRCDLQDVEADEDTLRFFSTSVKEALANGIRHGGATAFYIELKAEKDWVTLLISDNGSGLPQGFVEGFGLKQMRQKASVLGGDITIMGEDGEGCELIIKLPMGKKEKQ